MTTEFSVGAAPDATMNWQAIDWRQVHQNVRRLQIRIVKATQEGRRGKVKALQHLLTRWFSGRALAVRRVTENQGKTVSGNPGAIHFAASYAVSVRRASVLPAASSGFHLAVDTLAVQLTIPPAGVVRDFPPQVDAPCRAHQLRKPVCCQTGLLRGACILF
jgi:reverse transcriptase-like protein